MDIIDNEIGGWIHFELIHYGSLDYQRTVDFYVCILQIIVSAVFYTLESTEKRL